MHIDLTFVDFMTLIGMLMGGAWVLLKLSAIQFKRGIDDKFTGIKDSLQAQDKKLDHIDGLATKIHDVENEALRRHAEYLEKFCTKQELKDASEKTDNALQQIFNLLREIREDLHGKVSREECESCRPGRR